MRRLRSGGDTNEVECRLKGSSAFRAASASATPALIAPHRTRLNILVQVSLCAIPASALLGSGKAGLAGMYFWIVFGLVLLRLVILDRRDEILALLVALVPFIELLRQAVIYNIVVFLFVTAVAYYSVSCRAVVFRMLKSSQLVVGLSMFVSFYYLLSFTLTGAYEVHLRDFELLFVVIVVLIVSRRRELLVKALLGMLISTCAIGVAMLPYINSFADERLGQIMLEGHRMGNPVQLGGSLALCFLGLTVDRGAWFGLRNSPVKRLVCLGIISTLLALTSSRAGWLASTAGLIVIMIFAHRSQLNSRRMVLSTIGVGAIVIQIVLLSPYGEGLQKGFARTFGETDTLRHRTSGRSDQWVVAYYAFTQSFSSMVYGYGPGLSPKVYAKYSQTVEDTQYAVGKEAPFHSLYLEVAVESGVLGLIPVVIWLLLVGTKMLRWIRARGELFPVACFLGWVSITLSVGGSGAIGGLYVGIAMIATMQSVPLRKLSMNCHTTLPSKKLRPAYQPKRPAYQSKWRSPAVLNSSQR